jgi:hypothetical protein
VKGTEYTECQAFFPVVRIGSPTKGVAPLFGFKGRDTLSCGGGGGRTQFRRRDRHSGTLCMYTKIPLRVKEYCVSSRRHLFFQEKQKTHYPVTSHDKYRGFFVEAVRDQSIIFLTVFAQLFHIPNKNKNERRILLTQEENLGGEQASENKHLPQRSFPGYFLLRRRYCALPSITLI